MSLLIKALHKAEQEKTSEEKSTASAGNASLELTPIEPDLEAEAGFVDNEPVVRSARSEPGNAKQKAAGVVFAAKSGASRDATKMLLLGGVALLLLAAGGFYFYLESLKQPELVVSARVVEVTPTPVLPEAPAVEEIAEMEAAAAMGEFAQEAVAEAVSAPAEPTPADQGFSLAAAATAPVSRPVVSAPSPASQREVKVTINHPPPAINPNLVAAYQAFQAGDDAAAQTAYRRVLQADMRNTDALLGMAAIAMRQGRGNDAMGWYGKVLEIEPRNSFAQSAMATLLGQADPVSSESRIRNLIALQPDAAHLHAALGSLYAEHSQWSQAQQAYFEAHRLDTANPEHAFNLAVSLDQLGKSALALQYYRQTLSLLENHNAAVIDRVALESRIAQLQ
jgi:tetratricopeptide (TPR) repeat protein